MAICNIHDSTHPFTPFPAPLSLFIYSGQSKLDLQRRRIKLSSFPSLHQVSEHSPSIQFQGEGRKRWTSTQVTLLFFLQIQMFFPLLLSISRLLILSIFIFIISMVLLVSYFVYIYSEGKEGKSFGDQVQFLTIQFWF